MAKKIFTPYERFAIWNCHEKRCWLCTEPLSFSETTIDHFFAEDLIENNEKREQTFNEWGINEETFQINGFENWLPSHAKCNQRKSIRVPNFIPGNSFILNNVLIPKANKVKKTFEKLLTKNKKDKTFLNLLNAIETAEISIEDVYDFLKPISDDAALQIIPNDLIILSGGYWINKKDIVSEGYCKCENEKCVGSDEKLYCYFRPELSNWTIQKGLYKQCYDELIECPRCRHLHKRGEIGKENICKRPFSNQDKQTDN